MSEEELHRERGEWTMKITGYLAMYNIVYLVSSAPGRTTYTMLFDGVDCLF